MAVRTLPRWAVPVSEGAVVAAGGELGTMTVAALGVDALPSGLVTVTITCRRSPSSTLSTT